MERRNIPYVICRQTWPDSKLELNVLGVGPAQILTPRGLEWLMPPGGRQKHWKKDIEKSNRFFSAFAWIVALDCFDFGDPEPLTELLADTNTDVPPDIRLPLSHIISGARKPDLKAAAKMKIPGGKRLQLAQIIAAGLQMIEYLKRGQVPNQNGQLIKLNDAFADAQRIEPINHIRKQENASNNVIQRMASDWNVSDGTIRNLVRDLRFFYSNFPDI